MIIGKSNKMKLVGEYSIYPQYVCKICKQELWTVNKGGKQFLLTKNGKRHSKNKCNVKGDNKMILAEAQSVTLGIAVIDGRLPVIISRIKHRPHPD